MPPIKENVPGLLCILYDFNIATKLQIQQNQQTFTQNVSTYRCTSSRFLGYKRS